ncbi:6844_t:CDS:2, partial [Ambispora gerdemannii]
MLFMKNTTKITLFFSKLVVSVNSPTFKWLVEVCEICRHVDQLLGDQNDQRYWSEFAINTVTQWPLMIIEQSLTGKAFLRLTEEKLTRKNGLYELKASPAEGIMELVEQLKEKQEPSLASIEVVTASEFEKFRESNMKGFKKLRSDIDIAKAWIVT